MQYYPTTVGTQVVKVTNDEYPLLLAHWRARSQTYYFNDKTYNQRFQEMYVGHFCAFIMIIQHDFLRFDLFNLILFYFYFYLFIYSFPSGYRTILISLPQTSSTHLKKRQQLTKIRQSRCIYGLQIQLQIIVLTKFQPLQISILGDLNDHEQRYIFLLIHAKYFS